MNGKGSKPRPLSIPIDKFGEQWDSIFAKKTPKEWCKVYKTQIIDLDGWRVDSVPFDKPITEKEFKERLLTSTIALNAKTSRK